MYRPTFRSRLWRVWAIAVAALAMLIPATASAAPGTPRGMVVYLQDGGHPTLSVAVQPGEDAIAVDLSNGTCSYDATVEPSEIEPYLRNPLWHVLLRTEGGPCGYDYQHVRSLIEGAQPGGGKTWAQLMQQYPNVEWILQIGNEPTIDWSGVDAWTHRWWMHAVYDELATNSYGHIDQAWRTKYPMLKWAVAVGVTYDAAQIHLQWDTDFGGVRDKYDYIACHVYADTDMRSPKEPYASVYNFLLGDQFTKGVVVSEFGINGDPNPPSDAEVRNYRGWVNNLPSKVKLATAFVAMTPADQWVTYALDSAQDGQTLGDHWGGY